MKIIYVKHELVKEYDIYNTAAGDFMTAEFTEWKNKKMLERITIKKFSLNKKIEKINYCKEFDAIEIHYYESGNGGFVEYSAALKNCKIDCLRILLHAYHDNETITEKDECVHLPGVGQPDTSNGNVIVGG
ncbi:MAG: hypothetical protein JXR05_11690 [Flavobacteriaceae bacterium]